MLRLEHVDAGYGDIQVLWDVSIHVDAREFVVLVGANGAGKSTMMRTISSLIRPTGGTISFDGHRLDHMPAHRIIDAGIAHVPEDANSFRK